MLTRHFKLAALAIVLLTVATRLPSLLHPEPIDDEAMYSVVANEIVDGGRPYVDAVERKPPLLFWTYAAVFEATGKFNWKTLHAVALLWTLGTMAGLFVIGKQLFNRETGLIAALLYSVFQPWATWKNLAFNGELLMNLPIVWAWAIGFGRSPSRVRPELLAAGALLCIGFLLKQPAAIAAVPLGVYLLLPSYRTSRGLTRMVSLAQAATLTIGFFGTLGLVAIVLWQQGILPQAYYWTISDHSIPHVFWEHGILVTLAFVGACLPLLIGAAMAFRDKGGVWAGKGAERYCAPWTAWRFWHRRGGGRTFLSPLLHPIDPAADTARSTVLRTVLVWDGATDLMAAATRRYLRMVGPHCDCVFSRALAWARLATGTVGSRPISLGAFESRRQNFFLGPGTEGLSRCSTPARFALHHDVSTHRLRVR